MRKIPNIKREKPFQNISRILIIKCLNLNISVHERKRTRGIQSSIASAIALKEKRSTLLEAKDIRKAKQEQLENEIQEHQQRQQSQANYFVLSKDENTSLHLNSMPSNQEKPSKRIRLEAQRDQVGSLDDIIGNSRRLFTESDIQNVATNNDPISLIKQEKDVYVCDSDKQVVRKDTKWYQGDRLLGAPTTHPPITLFNEEDPPSQLSEHGVKIKTETSKIENDDESNGDGESTTTFSTIDILLNGRDDDGKSTLEIDEDVDEDNTAVEFSSTAAEDEDNEDLVSECMSQSQNPFPNVEELVSGLVTTATINTSCPTTGSSKTVVYSNGLIGSSDSPMSSQACSSVAS